MTAGVQITDEEIRRCAKGFVRGLLDGRSSQDMCFMVSSALGGYLSAMGVECELAEGLFDGWHHYWIAFPDGRVIDGTSDQFSFGLRKRHRTYWLEHSELHKIEY